MEIEIETESEKEKEMKDYEIEDACNTLLRAEMIKQDKK